MLTRHYQKNKEDLSKKRYRILSEKEKEKKNINMFVNDIKTYRK